MAVQYMAQASARTGGAGSGSLNIGARGPTKTILTGYIIAARLRFQAIGEPVPANQSPLTGCSNKLVIPIKTNAETRNMTTNLVLEIFIIIEIGFIKVLCNSKLRNVGFISKYLEGNFLSGSVSGVFCADCHFLHFLRRYLNCDKLTVPLRPIWR